MPHTGSNEPSLKKEIKIETETETPSRREQNKHSNKVSVYVNRGIPHSLIHLPCNCMQDFSFICMYRRLNASQSMYMCVHIRVSVCLKP